MTTPDVHVTLDELIALRRPAGRRVAPPAHPVTGLASGDGRSRARGRGIEFDEVRPYQAGDDIRAIDWRASARRGRTFTKLYSEERERTRFVVVDQRVGMFFGARHAFKSVAAARVAAWSCWSALARGDRVGGLVVGEDVVAVRARRTRQAVLALLHAVTEANRTLSASAAEGVTTVRLLDDCLAHAGGGDDVVLISDFTDHDARLAPLLAAVARGRALSLIRISDPLEETLDVAATVGISDGAHRRTLRIERGRRTRYLAERARRLERLEGDAAACGATLVHMSTGDEPGAASDDSFRPRASGR